MALDESVSALIGRIYQGAHDAALWDQVMLDIMARMEACAALFTVSDLHRSKITRARFYGSETARFLDGTREYTKGRYQIDRSFHFAVANPNARFCHTADLLPPSEYLADPFIRWNKPILGSTHWIVGYTPPTDELTLGISIHPPADVGPVSEDKIRLFKLLFEHIDRAMKLAAQPPCFVETGEALLLIDRNGLVRDASEAARALFDKHDGLALAGRRLHAGSYAQTARLDAAIRNALGALSEGGHGGAIALPRPSGKRDWLVTVTPLPSPSSPFGAFRPAALVRIVDPETGPPPGTAELWASCFRLSPTEVRIAKQLLTGDGDLRRAADQLEIAYATARVHLRNIFDKTGVHTQTQLARLLTRLRR